MPKNYLVKSLYRIQDIHRYVSHKTMLDKENFYHYARMQDLSIKSFQNHLKGEWELIYLQGTLPSLQESFIFTFEKVYQLWKTENCNILYADPDTLCLRDVEIFNKNYTACFEKNYTSGIRYINHNLPQENWDLALEKIKTWDYGKYAYEQDVVYAALNVAGPKVSELVGETPIDELDQVTYNDQKIIHLHSSRDPHNVLKIMHFYSFISNKRM